MNSKVKLIFKSTGMVLLLLMFSPIFFTIFNISSENISNKEYVFYLTLSNVVLLGIFSFIYKDTLKKDFLDFKNNLKKNLFYSIKYWIVGLIIMYVSNLFITYILKMSLPGNEEAVRNYINVSPIFMIINTLIFAPICEELAFRKSMRDAIDSKWRYILISGLLFGFLHIIGYIKSPIYIVYLIPYGALGISFSLLYYKTNNIYSTISMHTMHNALAILIYFLGVSL